MEKINQEQKARSDSVQIQIGKVENSFGLTIEEVSKIVKKEIELSLKESALIAEDKAKERLNTFSDTLLPKLEKSNCIDCFCDPAIQLFFRNTEKTAICTDSKNCYEILSEILIHRIQKKDDYIIIAATNKAVEIADKISEKALLFLTIYLCVNNFYPTSGDIKKGLNNLDNLYKNILNGQDIPYDMKIVDNLEIVGAIKVSSSISHKKFEDFISTRLDGYSCAGIQMNSKSYKKMKEILMSAKLSEKEVTSKSLLKNYVRINISKKKQLKKYKEKEKKALNEIYKLYDRSSKKVESAKKEFLQLLESYPNIIKVKDWWNKNIIKSGVVITPVGRVLGHVNAKNLDSRVPNIDTDIY